jgi:hypothetical protein
MSRRLPVRRNRRRDHLDYLPILLPRDLPHASFGYFANLGPSRLRAIHGYRVFLTVIHAVYFMVRLTSRLLHNVDYGSVSVGSGLLVSSSQRLCLGLFPVTSPGSVSMCR